MANLTGERQSSLSSDKLLAILECIAESRIPIRLQDLAERSGMTQPTVLRYLRTLQNANYVYQDETTLRYALTWKLCRLTENLDSYLGLRNIANPFVNHLANTLQQGVCLVVNRGDQCVYLDCVDHPHANYTPLQYIGKHAPLHATGSGKVLMSSFSETQVDEYILQKGLTRCTEYTITSRTQLLKALEQVRTQGFAFDDEECEIGLKCISYPLRNYSGSICAAISVFGNASEMSSDVLKKEIHQELGTAAEMISLRLGWTPKTS